MTETTHQVLNLFQIRKTKKQKRAFAAFVLQKAQENGYTAYTEKGSYGSENIVVGNIAEADVIYTAHYDTCPQLPVPNLITPKNLGLVLLYQLALSLGIIGVIWTVDFLIGFGVGYFGTLLGIDDAALLGKFAYILSLAGMLAIIWLLLAGPANKHTVNDNTSGVVTLLEIMQAMPDELRARAAFVFFDMEEVGLIGSVSFATMHKTLLAKKPVINFDCVSDGETMLFCVKKKAWHTVPLLEQVFVSDETVTVDIATKGFIYPSDQLVFPCGIGVAALKKSKRGVLYLDRIHTKRDVIFREENIRYLTEKSILLCRQLSTLDGITTDGSTK